MRWQDQTVEHQMQARLPGYADAVTRTFDAPEALHTRFHEIHTKSALNRVPGASRLPFAWTVNPYRGCSHACVYCLGGDTPILMADGTHRPLAELREGDEIYGTERHGSSRRLRRTTVLAHWSTVKPAYRITLADGTELMASGDHRFLTDRGWRHVTGAEHGPDRRPHLTLCDEMLGTGRFGRGGRDIEGVAVQASADLRVVSIEPLGTAMRLYDITTGTGDFIANGVVSHNCFARPTHEYLDYDAGRDFEREIVVKVNVPEVLRAELARPSWKGEHVALGTNTDPYQWVEGRYRLMPAIWEALRDAANPCSILTKSPLVLRDLELLKQIAARTEVSACLSVPTLDERAWRSTEPHTPSPRARLEAVAELNRAGIPTGVLIAPLMPGVNDAPEQVERIVQLATEAGAVHIGGNTLFLRGSVKEIYFDWLREHRPDLLERYERLYARGAYLPADERRSIEVAAGAPWARRTYPDRFRHRTAERLRAQADASARAEAAQRPENAQESLF
jgi:DNA repair photolyase